MTLVGNTGQPSTILQWINMIHVFVLDHPHTIGVFKCSKQQQMAKRVMASVQDGGYMGEKEPLLGDSESGSSLPERGGAEGV